MPLGLSTLCMLAGLQLGSNVNAGLMKGTPNESTTDSGTECDERRWPIELTSIPKLSRLGKASDFLYLKGLTHGRKPWDQGTPTKTRQLQDDNTMHGTLQVTLRVNQS